MTKHCGYIALLGRPNAGKSTLLNSLVGHKIAGVSRRPQTTRNRLLGISIIDDTQLIFLDTPGLHKDRRLLNSTMNRVAMSILGHVDTVAYLIDLTRGWHEEDRLFLRRLAEVSSVPVLVVGTKADAIKRGVIESRWQTIQDNTKQLVSSLGSTPQQLQKNKAGTKETSGPIDLNQNDLIISAKRPEHVAEFRKTLAEFMPEEPWLYGEDELTDMPGRFICSELIREQVFRQLGEEVPYGTAVTVDQVEDKPNIKVIDATIIVARSSHKGIVVGKQGQKIKALSTAARLSLERYLDSKVFLNLSVKVQDGWIHDQKLIAELAHISDDNGLNL